VVADPKHVEKQHAREPGDLRSVSIPAGRDRFAKAKCQTANAYVREESDYARSTWEAAEQRGEPLAEVVEGRAWPKENFHDA
jgi:hypothetical protein